jgi:hypothetical protein
MQGAKGEQPIAIAGVATPVGAGPADVIQRRHGIGFWSIRLVPRVLPPVPYVDSNCC